MQPSLIFTLLAASIGVSAIEPPRGPTAPKTNGTKLLTFNETVPASLVPSSVSLAWVASDVDGQYIYSGDDGSLILANAVTGENETFVAADQVPADYYDYWISSDLSRVLWAANYTKQYRHSYFADYFILDIDSGSLTPLVEDQVGDILYAEWSPTGEAIAFVRADNNLYIWTDSGVTQITTDGDPDTFNAIPDWVYEEEIFGDRYTLWWSPDGQKIAYLSFNETGVPTFRVPYYMDDNKYGTSYPRELELRYPKVDATNPTVAFNLLDVASSKVTNVPIDAFPADDLIIGEVAWVTEDHSNVVYRAFNRVQDAEKVVNVAVESASSSVVRERQVDNGWIDDMLAISYVGSAAGNGTNGTYYVDLSDASGWMHIYLYPVDGGAAIPLTSGEWEVRSILKVDSTRGLVYYTSTERHSTESHLYSVSYKTFKKTALVDDTVPGYWSASFSAGGSYYALSYQGPDVPYQELYAVNSTKPVKTLVDNAAFYAKLQQYKLPEISWLELEHPSGVTLNVMQRLPANFDPSKTYPVLFNPYGGPGAQQIAKSWKSLNWNAYISSDPELEYVQWVVDNRGTGYKGRDFRALVTKQLGKLEAEDQVWAAQQLKKESWVDPDHFSIWGWSFGGYLSSKVTELDSGEFSMALITAPVSDWRYYDSMYTERYMKTYTANAAGYNESAVRKTAGFKNIDGGFLIMHGVGDDNVHFQNSATLMDVLMGEGVSPEKLDSQWFTDSDHSINYNGDSPFLYKLITKRIYEEKNRVSGEYESHQWSKRQFIV